MMHLNGTITHGANMHSDQQRRVFLPVVADSNLNSYPVKVMPDAAGTQARSSVRVPADFVSDGVLCGVCTAFCGANLRMRLFSDYAADGQSYTAHAANAYCTVPLVSGIVSVFGGLSLPSISVDGILGAKVQRYGNDGLDTCVVDLYFIGMMFDYLADQ